jgi:hypothetical protein
VTSQLSFFTAGTQPPAVADLEGLLLGAGQIVRIGGTARLSVLVPGGWRAEALLVAFADRGLHGERAQAIDGQLVVRTPFSRQLLPVAQRWARGAIKAIPPRWLLDGPRLRMWAVAAGQADTHGYLLQLAPNDDGIWEPAGAALAAAGLAATFLGPRGGGPAYRVVGRRRLTRLREYVGDPPPGAAAAAGRAEPGPRGGAPGWVGRDGWAGRRSAVVHCCRGGSCEARLQPELVTGSRCRQSVDNEPTCG